MKIFVRIYQTIILNAEKVQLFTFQFLIYLFTSVRQENCCAKNNIRWKTVVELF